MDMLPITAGFQEICVKILQAYESKGQESLYWSDDQYQSSEFCGGWDPELQQFAFSYYAEDGGDYIFFFTIDEARVVAQGGNPKLSLNYWKERPGFL